jgi:hypothetical protein
MIDELKSIWKEAVVAYSKHYLGVWLDRLRKTTKTHSKNNRCPGRVLKWAPLEYDSEETWLVETASISGYVIYATSSYLIRNVSLEIANYCRARKVSVCYFVTLL